MKNLLILSLLVLSCMTLVLADESWCNQADINHDGTVDGYENDKVIVFYDSIDCSLDNYWCSGSDINKDGNVSDYEVSLIVGNFGQTNCSGQLSEDWCSGADINQNGEVDDWDNAQIVGMFGQIDCSSYNWCSGADINQDNVVDGIDNDYVVGNYGRTDCNPNITNETVEPEPIIQEPSHSGGGSRNSNPVTCNSNWTCSNWSNCINNIQFRTCSYLSCKPTQIKPEEYQVCGEIVSNQVTEQDNIINNEEPVNTPTNQETIPIKESKSYLWAWILGIIIIILILILVFTRNK